MIDYFSLFAGLHLSEVWFQELKAISSVEPQCHWVTINVRGTSLFSSWTLHFIFLHFLYFGSSLFLHSCLLSLFLFLKPSFKIELLNFFSFIYLRFFNRIIQKLCCESFFFNSFKYGNCKRLYFKLLQFLEIWIAIVSFSQMKLLDAGSETIISPLEEQLLSHYICCVSWASDDHTNLLTPLQIPQSSRAEPRWGSMSLLYSYYSCPPTGWDRKQMPGPNRNPYFC